MRDPVAGLVWSCREEIADISEQTEGSARPKTYWTGARRTEGIFELYQASFDAERTE